MLPGINYLDPYPPDSSEEPIGEGGDFATSACYNEFEGTNGACILRNCSFFHSRAAEKGAAVRFASNERENHVEIQSCLIVNASCGAVSSANIPITKNGMRGSGLSIGHRWAVTLPLFLHHCLSCLCPSLLLSRDECIVLSRGVQTCLPTSDSGTSGSFY